MGWEHPKATRNLPGRLMKLFEYNFLAKTVRSVESRPQKKKLSRNHSVCWIQPSPDLVWSSKEIFASSFFIVPEPRFQVSEIVRVAFFAWKRYMDLSEIYFLRPKSSFPSEKPVLDRITLRRIRTSRTIALQKRKIEEELLKSHCAEKYLLPLTQFPLGHVGPTWGKISLQQLGEAKRKNLPGCKGNGKMRPSWSTDRGEVKGITISTVAEIEREER